MVAGGYFEDIPSDKLDLFIAGCSCVDYSSLNNSKDGKTYLPVFEKYPPDIVSGKEKSPARLDAEFVERLIETLENLDGLKTGESMRTFLAAMSYIIRTRPKIVILENIDSAPWTAKTNFWFPRAGYVAAHAKVNSRRYYVPQTRQRGYLVAVDVQVFGAERAQAVIEHCMKLVKKLERNVSSPVTDFLLAADDPRLVQARADMEQRNANQKEIDWGFSQLRHEATRQAEGLSAASHPFSMSVFAHGKLKEVTPPSRSWIQYFKKQMPRVLDFIDIVILKGLQVQCDLRYKTWVLDVSQNVDRSTIITSNFESKFGTIGCITPTGQPILTDQVRPITGIEALGLQGLPLDDLVLSTETQAQLLDLAGNAMTVPVVGAVILAALAAAYDVLRETAEGASPPTGTSVGDPMEEDRGPESSFLEDMGSWDLGSFRGANLDEVVTLVSRSVRLCFCPGVEGIASGQRQWLRCQDCGATACKGCRGNPRHRFAELAVLRRMSQAELQLQLRSCLPGVFGVRAEGGDVAGVLAREGCEPRYVAGVARLVGRTNLFYLQQVKVTECVTVDYKSTDCVARLVLTNTGADWYLFPARLDQDVKSSREDSQPVARGKFAPGSRQPGSSEQTLDPREAAWSVWVRRRCDHDLVVEAEPAQQALRVRLAEGGAATRNAFPPHVLKSIEERVGGVYCAKPRCGTPEDSLFVRQDGSSEQFLFKDVAPTGPPKEDTFVFSDTNRQLEAGEYREVSLRTGELSMPPAEGVVVRAHVDGYWAACKPFDSGVPKSMVREPLAVSSVGVFTGGNGPCCRAPSKPATLFNVHLDVTELPLPLATVSRWTNGRSGPLNFYAVPPSRLDSFLRDIAFACPSIFKAGAIRLAELGTRGRGAEVVFCAECCIAPPRIHWQPPDSGAGAAHPWEDPDDVGLFEQRLRMLPPPFAAMVKFAGHSFQDYSIGALDISFTLNSRTLASRAMAHLAYGTRSRFFSGFVMRHSRVFCEVDWQYHPEETLDSLVPFHKAIHDTTNLYGLREDYFRHHIANVPLDLPCFRSAGHSLREDQAGAVRWMIGREVCPAAYSETELEEVVPLGLNTRIVGRAVFENDGSLLCSRGGVAAHDIGYGKTVVVIALLELRRGFDCDGSIDERKKAAALWSAPCDHSESFFHLKATLIIVPGHISDQWISEFGKFGSKAKIIKILDVKALENLSLIALRDADVIVVSEGLFRSAAYIENIDRLGKSTPDSKSNLSDREAQDRYRAGTKMIRWAVTQYLKNGSDVKSTNEGLLKLVEERQAAGQKVADEYVAPSTRKGSKGGKTTAKGKAIQAVPRRPANQEGHDALWHPTLFLENFSFARIIVDEYSYQSTPTLSFLSGSLAYAKWLLSGTPPSQNLSNITDVGIALGIHVARPEPCVRPGLPAVTEGPRLHPMSPSEEFRSFSTRIKSMDFIMERHRHGIEFVRHVYRSNPLLHSNILVDERVVPVRLRPRTAVYYNVAHLEISDANGNLLQVPMDIRKLLNRVNVAATNSGEVAANLALAAVANGVLGNGGWYEDMGRALATTVIKFENDTKFCFDKLVWLLDRARSVGAKIQNDSKFQAVRNVAEGVIRDFVRDFRGENRNLSKYGGQLPFTRLMSRLAPATVIRAGSQPITPRALYLPPSDASNFEPRVWRRDMAHTFWLDWYDVTESQVATMDRNELVHLASDIVLLSYSSLERPPIKESSVSHWLSMHENIVKSLFSDGGYANWHLRQNTAHRSMMYERVGRPIIEKLDNRTLANFIMACQKSKIDANEASLSRLIDTGAKTSKAELRDICRNHNLKFTESDTGKALLEKIDRYTKGLTDGSDHIDGRGTSMSQEFPMLNKIRKVRSSAPEATLDEINMTYQRFIRSIEDYVQTGRRVEFFESISRLAQSGPGAQLHCDSCLGQDPGTFVVVACGHIMCDKCKVKMDQNCERSTCTVESCTAYCRNSPILRWADLIFGVPKEHVESCDWSRTPKTQESRNPGAGLPVKAERGAKLAAIIDKVKSVPADEHVLLFVPFVWLAAEIERCFGEEGITYITLIGEKGLADQEMSERAELFKTGCSKALILDPTEVSCAGINLTIANHVIFAAPFLEPDVYKRNQNMRQAIGRCVRPGQDKVVYVYHYMAENTIEERALRDYARTHQNPDNAIARHFSNSPKPWWLLQQDDAEAAANKDNGAGAGGDPSPSTAPAPAAAQEKVQHAQRTPVPLAPAGGQPFEPKLEPDEEPVSSPDLWQRMAGLMIDNGMVRDDGDDGGDVPLCWDYHRVRLAIRSERMRRSAARTGGSFMAAPYIFQGYDAATAGGAGDDNKNDNGPPPEDAAAQAPQPYVSPFLWDVVDNGGLTEEDLYD